MKNNIDIIVVLGPTATGKTTFATNLALKLDGEIISADSRQVYREMDIGTGKDIEDYTIEGKEIPYHLLDIVEPGYEYNVFEYQKDFLKAYNDITSRGKIPILCGGSGLYLEAALKGYKLINVPVDENLRSELEVKSDEELLELLKSMRKLHNTSDSMYRKRLIRAIEIELYYKEHDDIDLNFPKLNALVFGINFDRKIVRQRITERLKERLKGGMLAEVQKLLDKGVTKEKLVYYGLEYKFISQYLTGEFKYNDMFQKLNSAIHQFSKRQMTWFRRMEKNGTDINWLDGQLPLKEKIVTAERIIAERMFDTNDK